MGSLLKSSGNNMTVINFKTGQKSGIKKSAISHKKIIL